MASQVQNDPIVNIRTGVSAAQIALAKISTSISQLVTASPNDAGAVATALSAIGASTTDVETILTAANLQLVAQQKQIADLTVAGTACQAALTAANSKLAQVPKTANGAPAKPGMYFSAPVVGAIAVGVGLLGAFGGFWYRGTGHSKKLLGPGKAREEAAEEEADEPKRKKK